MRNVVSDVSITFDRPTVERPGELGPVLEAGRRMTVAVEGDVEYVELFAKAVAAMGGILELGRKAGVRQLETTVLLEELERRLSGSRS